MKFLPQGKLADARFLALLIQHHETIIQLLKAQQNKILEDIELDVSKDYDLNLDTGEITDAAERGSDPTAL